MKNTTVKCIELPYATAQGEFKLKVNMLAPLKLFLKVGLAYKNISHVSEILEMFCTRNIWILGSLYFENNSGTCNRGNPALLLGLNQAD